MRHGTKERSGPPRPPTPSDPPGAWTRYDRAAREGGGAGGLRAASWEERLAALDGTDRPLPLVALRCADRVEPVRERARALLREALDGAAPAEVVAVAGVALAAAGRRHGGWGRELVAERLAHARVREALLSAADPATRRFAHRTALDAGLLPAGRAAWAATWDPDRRVRAMCLAVVADAPDAREADLDALLASKWPDARAAAVDALGATGRGAAAERFLADRSRAVRTAAREAVRTSGGRPADWCRARCAEAERWPYAPLGLAECAERTDGDTALLRELTAHPTARVRASAVAGLRLLDPEGWRTVLPLLDDPSAAVVRETGKTLVENAHRVPVEALAARTAPGRSYLQRSHALRVLAESYRTEAFVELMRMLDDPHPTLRSRAALAASRRGWVADGTTPAAAAELLELLDRHAGLFARRAAWMRESLARARDRR
ncbi:hypothetical protein ACF1CG_30990 [Streptomyces sp. NPDC014773]|uniref:hypothetical protein n=1 Tax=Streptomyces sp. NPDC014773 TaxID=3364908 RepID=UPI0037033DBE